MTPAARTTEGVARAAYGRLVAMLAARTRDIAAAEDALADAFAAALATWPLRGIPERPEAWLMATAKNRLTDAARRASRAPVEPVSDLPEVEAMIADPDTIPDDRLRLMFACAHPAIAPDLRAPLMLQCVLGLDAARIARAWAVPQAAMAQRLVRAKAKICDAGIGFVLPGLSDMPARLPPVLEAIYGAYAGAWMDPDGADLSDEALWLARLVPDLLPEVAEAQGLAALIALSRARSPARVKDGALVPLSEQDTALWDGVLLAEGASRLATAYRLRQPGRFQIEAAIEEVHCHRRVTGQTDWPAVLTLTEALLAGWPTLGAEVNRAVALAEVQGAAAGLAALPDVEGFQPALAARAHFLLALRHEAEAVQALDATLALTPQGPSRRYLLALRAAVGH